MEKPKKMRFKWCCKSYYEALRDCGYITPGFFSFTCNVCFRKIDTLELG